jgi:hypothetical protein
MKDKFNNAVGPQVHTRGVVATCSYAKMSIDKLDALLCKTGKFPPLFDS